MIKLRTILRRLHVFHDFRIFMIHRQLIDGQFLTNERKYYAILFKCRRCKKTKIVHSHRWTGRGLFAPHEW